MRARSGGPARVLLALAAAACAEPVPDAPMPALDAVRLEGADLSRPIAGELGGRAFRARDVRFRVVRGERRERVDLLVSDRRIERCGLPLARPETLLWLRAPGRAALEPGELSSEDGAVEPHWERPGEDGIDGVHRGVARVAIEAVDAQRIEGVLRVCFADAEGSCAGGRFRARPCASRVDGRALREPPGLADDALEAAGEAP